jgi:DNA end-binding protein Ku
MPATVWKGFISFGLVSFPVRLHSAARAETVHFRMLHKKDGSRLKEVWYCAEEDKPVERSEIAKGYEIAKDQYVIVDEEELRKIAPATATAMEILQFVDSGEVDPIYFERSYYVAAEENTAKPYALFAAAMSASRQHAIARIAMHNREHIALIRPSDGGLVLHTLYFPNELNASNRSAAPQDQYSAKEMELARSLIDHLKAPFHPHEFKDTYRENVERLIEQKRKGQEITAVEQPRTAPVIDLMEALKRSLESSRPASPARKGASRATAKKTSGKRSAA